MATTELFKPIDNVNRLVLDFMGLRPRIQDTIRVRGATRISAYWITLLGTATEAAMRKIPHDVVGRSTQSLLRMIKRRGV